LIRGPVLHRHSSQPAGPRMESGVTNLL